MKEVFVCSIKIIGARHVVLTKEEAEAWEAQDPEMNYYTILPVLSLS